MVLLRLDFVYCCGKGVFRRDVALHGDKLAFRVKKAGAVGFYSSLEDTLSAAENVDARSVVGKTLRDHEADTGTAT